MELCEYCEAPLYPECTLIAFHGLLFCSLDCAVDYEIDRLMRIKATHGLTSAEVIALAEQTVENDYEEVMGRDIGL